LGWINKRQKCTESFYQTLSNEMKDKNNVSDKLWFNLYELSKVINRNSHVTACFSAVNKRCFCWLSEFFFYFSVWEKHPMRSNATTSTCLWWKIFWNNACGFETWNLNTKRNKMDRENVLQIILQERNFPELTTEKENMKIKTVRTRQSAELNKKW